MMNRLITKLIVLIGVFLLPIAHGRSDTSYHNRRNLESNVDFTNPEVMNRPIDLNFDKALELLNKVSNLIYQRFEFHNKQTFQFFLGSSNLPFYAWDLMKFKIAIKIIQFAIESESKTGQTFTSANIPSSQEYLMIFGGSSVTAGHDNYYHQAYPFVFERRLVDIFHHLGMKLIVRNIAQGGNNCRPSDYCYEAMGGDNPDFIVWEQSFNCGRSRDIPEYMARVAYWSGGVVYYSASGAFQTNGCQKTTDPIPWTREEWTPEGANITSPPYEITPEKTADYRTLISAWYDDGNAVSRWTNQVFGGLYRAVGPHGYSVWGHSGKLCNNGAGCDAINVKGECFENGGPHWMVADTSYYANEPGKHGKSWHPPAGMHLMRGEILAYNFAHILADTIFMIKEDLKTLSKADALQKYKKAWEELRTPIPERALHLSVAEGADRAYCYTNFKPHFNPKYLLEKIILKSSQWSFRAFNHNEESTFAKYGYQDTRPIFEAKGGGLEIHIRIDRVRNGEIRVCGYSFKDALVKTEMFLDPSYPFPDANTTPTQEVEYKPTEKKYQLTNVKAGGDECVLIADVPKGDGHVLIIKTMAEPAHHMSVLSHVVIF